MALAEYSKGTPTSGVKNVRVLVIQSLWMNSGRLKFRLDSNMKS